MITQRWTWPRAQRCAGRFGKPPTRVDAPSWQKRGDQNGASISGTHGSSVAQRIPPERSEGPRGRTVPGQGDAYAVAPPSRSARPAPAVGVPPSAFGPGCSALGVRPEPRAGASIGSRPVSAGEVRVEAVAATADQRGEQAVEQQPAVREGGDPRGPAQASPLREAEREAKAEAQRSAAQESSYSDSLIPMLAAQLHIRPTTRTGEPWLRPGTEGASLPANLSGTRTVPVGRL